MEKSLDGISYLDILLNKQDEVIIITDLYIKKKTTDTISILHFNSCHRRHTKRAIRYNLARKICTLVNSEPVKIQRLHLKQFLLKQNYSGKIIDDAIEKSKKSDRNDLLNPTQQNKPNP